MTEVQTARADHDSCIDDSDCTLADPTTECGGACPVAVSKSGEQAFAEALQGLSDEHCVGFGPACGYVSPGCAPAHARCEAGHCVLGAGDGASSALQWFTTCGAPACGPGVYQDKGLDPCTAEELAGRPCAVEGAECDPISNCNHTLVCGTSDPKNQPGGCPI